jgi:predicted DNA-binding transcriptional regulator AlpA
MNSHSSSMKDLPDANDHRSHIESPGDIDALADIDLVCRRTGLSESTIRRMRERGHFPDGEMRGRKRRWSLAAIAVWQELRKAAQVEQARQAAERSLQPRQATVRAPAEDVQLTTMTTTASVEPDRRAGSSVFLPEHLHRARMQSTNERRRAVR